MFSVCLTRHRNILYRFGFLSVEYTDATAKTANKKFTYTKSKY